jgi:hypothetical protein
MGHSGGKDKARIYRQDYLSLENQKILLTPAIFIDSRGGVTLYLFPRRYETNRLKTRRILFRSPSGSRTELFNLPHTLSAG